MNARYARLVTVSLAFMLLLGQSGVVTAQDGPTASPYTTVTGQVLMWAEPWSIVEDDALQTADLDLVFLTDGMTTVAVSTGDIIPENSRGLVIGFLGGDTGAVQVLDQGAGTTTSYWFDQFPVGGEPHGAFSIATSLSAEEAVLVMYISPVLAFGEGLTSAQENVTLDEVPLFGGVDGMALQTELGAVADASPSAGNLVQDDAQALPEFLPIGQWVDRTYDVQVM
jgi:hypothetical protein